MSAWPFASARAARASARILFDIGADSAAGACVFLLPGRPPTIAYAKRVPVEVHEGDTQSAALGRALALIAGALESNGMTALARLAPGTRLAGALAALDAPWASAAIRVEEERPAGGRPFVFSKRLLAEMLRRAERAAAAGLGDRIEQQVVGARLNGYPTADPMDGVAHRASLVILVSKIAGDVGESVRKLARERFQIQAPRIVAGAALRYRALAALFPHERDLLILDATGSAAALSLVRGKTLVALHEFNVGGGEAWAGATEGALRDLAAKYPLPRTILLAAEGDAAAKRQTALETSGIGALWFAETPPRIIAVPRVAAGAVALAPQALPDMRLALAAFAAALPEYE